MCMGLKGEYFELTDPPQFSFTQSQGLFNSPHISYFLETNVFEKAYKRFPHMPFYIYEYTDRNEL